MEIEHRVRVRINELGWKAFMESFHPRSYENVLLVRDVCLCAEEKEMMFEGMKALRAIMTVLGSSRMVIPFERVSEGLVNEHKLWLLMDYAERHPECIPYIETRL